MITATGLRWIMTVLFCALTLYGVWRALASGSAHGSAHAHAGHPWVARLAHLLHAVMALAMLAMVWPWGMDLLVVPQVVFFSLAAGWFLLAAVAWPGEPARGRALLSVLPHAVMTGAMAWMVAAMAWGTSMGSMGGGGEAMADMPGMDMQGMDMSGSGAAGAMELTGAGDRWSAGVLAFVLLVLALWWLTRGFDTGRRAPRPDADGVGPDGVRGALDLGCHGAMALGMAVMFVVMV
ncbi:DUF5134 domain-containing protein [Streptomyces sp. SID10853]|uniref:DUF5134 domain-containing protein n=1 Tax=Streptomyces sp. SID10853 TaxID=2706028 RepID=UPI0013C158C4|nr:DUF5134 domain-containing protein [Streptomyces sp. SID10853]NDZ78983.1 DUF5134 domain-containing protein [Streptomyces sp. SID10853]